MHVSYSADQAPPLMRRHYWSSAIARTYFPLELEYKSTPTFAGTLDVWSLGKLSISRNATDGLLYRRHERHLLQEREENYLITVPERSEIRFMQDGKDVRCKPGSFLVERSHLPYEFSHSESNALWVLKVPRQTLRARIRQPERLATLSFDSTRGVGALFTDMMRLVAVRVDETSREACELAGRHMVDLLALAVEQDDRVLGSGLGSVQSAHLHRAERFVRTHLAHPHLSPQMIAEACGISVRYLHQLFETQGTTVSAWIRRQRLLSCDEMLRDPACHKSICEIAYEWGFGDQAQFSRHYRSLFGCTPSETRLLARAAAEPSKGQSTNGFSSDGNATRSAPVSARVLGREKERPCRLCE